MTQNLPTGPDNEPRRAMTRRRRDFIVVLASFAAILTVFVLLQRLGLIEALSALAVAVSFAVAYFVGSASSAPPAASASRAPETPEVSRQRVLNAIPLPAFELDSEARIVMTNTQAAAVLHVDGKTAPRASTVIRSPALLSAIEKVRREGADPPLIAEFEAGADETWRVHVSRAAEASRMLVVLEDMTLARRTARTRADFIANASHELLTPLTTISGMIDTLRGPARDDVEARTRFLDVMAREAARMQRLIQDLLSLSRIESSERVQPEQQEDLNAIVRETVAMMQTPATVANVTLVIDADDTSVPVLAHRDEMVQVVENLVSNAVKYAPKGGVVRVSFGAGQTAAEARGRAAQRWEDAERITILAAGVRVGGADTSVWLRVEDTGSGIEAQHLTRLGERFYRADQSRGGAIKGTGLGLAIVKHIMAHHRGGLGVETRSGKGSAFGIWFPAPE